MIVKHPDPILLRPTRKVAAFNESLITLTVQMFFDMRDNHGQGLAANQIGIDLSVAVISVQGFPRQVLINPVITKMKGNETSEEGCLSIPGTKLMVKRATKIWVNYQDTHGVNLSLICVDELARCIQHEVDHLNGITIIERTQMQEEV